MKAILFLLTATASFAHGQIDGKYRATLTTFRDTAAEDFEFDSFGEADLRCDASGTLVATFDIEGSNGQAYHFVSTGTCSATSLSFTLRAPFFIDYKLVFINAKFDDQNFQRPRKGHVWERYGQTPGGPPYDRAVLGLKTLSTIREFGGACLSTKEVERKMHFYRSQELPFKLNEAEIRDGRYVYAGKGPEGLGHADRRAFQAEVKNLTGSPLPFAEHEEFFLFRATGASMGCRYDRYYYLTCDGKIGQR